MSHSIGGKVLTAVAVLLIAIVGFVALRANAQVSREYKNLQAKREEVSQEIQAMNARLSELRENQTRFREDPEFVAHLARQEKYTCPGEIVFKFPVPADD